MLWKNFLIVLLCTVCISVWSDPDPRIVVTSVEYTIPGFIIVDNPAVAHPELGKLQEACDQKKHCAVPIDSITEPAQIGKAFIGVHYRCVDGDNIHAVIREQFSTKSRTVIDIKCPLEREVIYDIPEKWVDWTKRLVRTKENYYLPIAFLGFIKLFT